MEDIKVQLQGGVFVDYTNINNATKVLAYFAINHDALHILMCTCKLNLSLYRE